MSAQEIRRLILSACVMLALSRLDVAASPHLFPGRNPPVQIVLKVSSKVVCQGTKTLRLTAEIRNKTRKSINIDPASVWGWIYVDAEPTDEGDKVTFRTQTFIKEEYLYKAEKASPIDPGGTYTGVNDLSLTDKFFDTLGEYRITISYRQFKKKTINGDSLLVGDIDSNQETFEIVKCENP